MDILNEVKNEVLEFFEENEIKKLSWDNFWNEIDVLNAYEESWDNWKSEGIKEVYKKVFEEIKNN